MSASNEWTEWHLTPNGWVQGSCKLDGVEATTVPRPVDAVMSCTHSDYRSSVFSKPNIKFSVDWQSTDAALIESLLQKFGKCPDEI